MTDSAAPSDVQVCYRHADRRAGVRCQRCDRPICPDCMHQASVGFHCPECVSGSGQRVYTARDLRTSGVAAAPITVGLIAVNVVIYIINQGAGFSFTVDWGTIGLGVSQGSLLGVGADEPWRLVTGAFLHGNLIHIGFNMYLLYLFGQQLERTVGPATYLAVYFTSLLAGSLGVMVLSPYDLTVGASGAVFGLFGYALSNQLSRGINPFQTGLGGLLVLNLALTFVISNISIGGHIGGLIGGFLCAQLVDNVGARNRLPSWVVTAMVVVLGVGVGLAAVTAAPATF